MAAQLRPHCALGPMAGSTTSRCCRSLNSCQQTRPFSPAPPMPAACPSLTGVIPYSRTMRAMNFFGGGGEESSRNSSPQEAKSSLTARVLLVLGRHFFWVTFRLCLVKLACWWGLLHARCGDGLKLENASDSRLVNATEKIDPFEFLATNQLAA